MKSLHDKAFISLWQLLYRATAPSASEDRWYVDDVEWCKQRHHFTGGGDYSFSIEAHRLSSKQKGKSGWALLVVTEYWWNAQHESMRSSLWARPLSGSKRAILDWFREQGRTLQLST